MITKSISNFFLAINFSIIFIILFRREYEVLVNSDMSDLINNLNI